MLTVDARYLANMVAPVKTARVRLIENVEEDPIELLGTEDLMSFKIEAVGSLLGTAGKKATIKLIGAHDALKDRTFIAYGGIQDPTSGEWDEALLGYFDISTVEVDYDKGFTVATGFDGMYRAGATQYNLNAEDYPMTVAELAGAVASELGLELADMTGLPNATHEIPEDLYRNIAGFTLRNVIDEVAKSTATTARVSGGVLTFVPYTMTASASLTNDNLKTYKAGKRFGVINSIVLSRMPQEDNIVLSDNDSVAVSGLTEIKIINVEILDDDRQSLIVPIYEALAQGGAKYMDAIEMKTEGHGIYEVGDTLAIAVTSNDVTTHMYAMVTDILLDISGGMTEVIKCVPPDPTRTDYLTAGGIVRSIYNTEIKVDKQGQEITSVVSRQDEFEGEVSDNFSQVHQDIENITNTFQSIGGTNLIENSVGYAVKSDGEISKWAWNNDGTRSAVTSPESQNRGALSGNQINLTAGASLTQRVIVQDNSDTHYSLSFMVKKGHVGVARVSLLNSTDNYYVEMADSTPYDWQSFSINGIEPSIGYFDVVIEVDEGVVDFAITDLMLNVGETSTKWAQANGEVLNTQVQLNSDGITVKSSIYEGDYTAITPLEFAGYSSASGTQQRVFSLNRDTTVVQKLQATGQITMEPIKIVPITSGDKAGWAFVRSGGTS